MNKLMLFVLTLCLSGSSFAQAKATTPKAGSPDRKGIMDALRPRFEKPIGKPIVFEVRYLKMAGGWAMFEGEPRRPGGKPIDWAKTKYAEDIKEGVMDSISLALLQKKGGKWKIVELAIGPTDYPVEEWMRIHKSAPRSIFRKMG